MQGRSVFCAAVLLWISTAALASAQSTLTLSDVLARARERAPEIAAALARVDEARGRLVGSSIRFRDNPTLEFETGPRSGLDPTWDIVAALGQTFETGGQRRARMAIAQSDIHREMASADDVVRAITREAGVAFVRALGAEERLRLLTAAEQVARELQSVSERRYQAGDIAALDVNLTRIAAARAAAHRAAAQAEVTRALLPVRMALGIAADAPLALAGPLERTPAAREALIAVVNESPALRATDAELAQAQAELRLAQATGRPDVAARLTVKREDGDRAVLGGLTFTLPAFDRGQGLAATASARTRRLTLERDAARRAITLTLETALEEYSRRATGARMLAEVALPATQDNENLATRSFEAGELSLLNLLLVRQDVLSTRLSYVDALTETAVAAVDIDARAGVLR
jgi:cobalt-zinc-cadmium efflux system outer membrane protein